MPLRNDLTNGILVYLLGEEKDEPPCLVLTYHPDGYKVLLRHVGGNESNITYHRNLRAALTYFASQIPEQD